jgi:hypothetical protein
VSAGRTTAQSWPGFASLGRTALGLGCRRSARLILNSCRLALRGLDQRESGLELDWQVVRLLSARMRSRRYSAANPITEALINAS